MYKVTYWVIVRETLDGIRISAGDVLEGHVLGADVRFEEIAVRASVAAALSPVEKQIENRFWGM